MLTTMLPKGPPLAEILPLANQPQTPRTKPQGASQPKLRTEHWTNRQSSGRIIIRPTLKSRSALDHPGPAMVAPVPQRGERCPWRGERCPWRGERCPWRGERCPWRGERCPWRGGIAVAAPFQSCRILTFPLFLSLSKDAPTVGRAHHERDGQRLWKDPVPWPLCLPARRGCANIVGLCYATPQRTLAPLDAPDALN